MFLPIILFFLGCGNETITETPPPTYYTLTTETETEESGCDKVIIDYYGADSPVVGDVWTIWMKCDGVTMIGASVIQFEPLDFATIDENEITFQQEGTGLLMMQTGSFQAELTIDVGPTKN